MLDAIIVLLYAVLALGAALYLHAGAWLWFEILLAIIAVRVLYWGLDITAQVLYFKLVGRRRVVEETLRILREHHFPTDRSLVGLDYELYLFQVSRDAGSPEAMKKAAGDLQTANDISKKFQGGLRTRLVKQAQDAALAIYLGPSLVG